MDVLMQCVEALVQATSMRDRLALIARARPGKADEDLAAAQRNVDALIDQISRYIEYLEGRELRRPPGLVEPGEGDHQLNEGADQ